MRPDLSAENLLTAYTIGVFPMAGDEGELHWLAPDPRAVLELQAFRVSRSLRAAVRRGHFTMVINRGFEQVMHACANRVDGTWISAEIHDAYCALHRLGFAHSVEAWVDGELAGGLYGVSINGAFFGESMFHHVTDASKVALVFLVERMRQRGLVLLDVQFMTDHLRQFGVVEIPRADYEERLGHALEQACSFVDQPAEMVELQYPDRDAP